MSVHARRSFTLGMRTSIGARPHRVIVKNPGRMIPDGDGGYVNLPDISPVPWQVAIISATAADIQNSEADTVIATKLHLVHGQYRGDISTKSQLVFTDLDGKVRTFDVDGVENIEQRNFELVVSCTELESPPPPTLAPPNVLDAFNRPDENPLSNDGMWQKTPNPSADAPLQLVSQEVGFLSTGWAGSSWMTAQAGDFDIYATVPVLPEPGNQSQFGVSLWPDAGAAGFVMSVAVNDAAPYVLLIQPDGTRTTVVYAGVFSAGDAVGISRRGSQYLCRLRIDGTWQVALSVDDPSTPGPLYPGLWVQNYVPSALTRLDDFALVVSV